MNTNQYFWDFGNGTASFYTSENHGDSVTYTYNTPGNFTPSVILKDSLGCTYAISGNPVSIDKLIANFSFGDAIRCDLSNISFYNSSSFYFPATYIWDFGDGDSSNYTTASHFYNSSGIYHVNLSATSSMGC
ncbi:MAG: PKD domain-containing protein, partial [Bacteroidetes bacterium]|nr:PKD domain-containing protein [Bacteroidota bacterium]